MRQVYAVGMSRRKPVALDSQQRRWDSKGVGADGRVEIAINNVGSIETIVLEGDVPDAGSSCG